MSFQKKLNDSNTIDNYFYSYHYKFKDKKRIHKETYNNYWTLLLRNL